MAKRILFYTAVALQLVLLLGMIGRKAYTTAHGERIRLRCGIYDPRDLFRGDYVHLTYDISRPDYKVVKGLKESYEGQPVYVTLRKNGAFWDVTGVYPRLPRLSDDEVFIKGRASKCGEITYGIESYFVPEGKGRSIESRRGELTAEIALDRLGHAVLLQIFLDGRAVP